MVGLAAGLYSGITYGMKEARGGAHDWVSLINICLLQNKWLLPSLYCQCDALYLICNHTYIAEKQCSGWSIDRSGTGYDNLGEDKP